MIGVVSWSHRMRLRSAVSAARTSALGRINAASTGAIASGSQPSQSLISLALSVAFAARRSQLEMGSR